MYYSLRPVVCASVGTPIMCFVLSLIKTKEHLNLIWDVFCFNEHVKGCNLVRIIISDSMSVDPLTFSQALPP